MKYNTSERFGMILNIPIDTDTYKTSHNGNFKIKSTPNNSFIDELSGKYTSMEFLSQNEILYAQNQNADWFSESEASLFIQLLHNSFGEHVPFSLNPEVLWYMIVHEVSILIKSEEKKYAKLFTKDPGNQQLITVVDNSLMPGETRDWTKAIHLFRKPLENRIGIQTVKNFLPEFSMSTPESQVVTLINLMNVVSNYYKYHMVSTCHIPKIRLEGTPNDWTLLLNYTMWLYSEFSELEDYFKNLLKVLSKIELTAYGKEFDVDFWRSIYKYDEMSGGPYVTGWITSFSAYLPVVDGYRLKDEFDWREAFMTTNQFSSHFTKVNFTWDNFGETLNMFLGAGVIGSSFDGFLTPELGFGVFRV